MGGAAAAMGAMGRAMRAQDWEALEQAFTPDVDLPVASRARRILASIPAHDAVHGFSAGRSIR